LLDLTPPTARLVRNGEEQEVPLAEVKTAIISAFGPEKKFRPMEV